MSLRTDEQYQRIENREAIRLKVRQIARRVGDLAVSRADVVFDEAIASGSVLRVGFTDKELEQLVRRIADRTLPEPEAEGVR